MLLADTTFVVDLLRNRHNVKKVQKNYESENIGLSVISISELYTGLYYTQQKLGEEIFNKKLKDLQKILLNFDIMELNEEIMAFAGEMRALQLLKGKTIDMMDLIIGATGKFYHVGSIITRNTAHFECWKIPLVDYQK